MFYSIKFTDILEKKTKMHKETNSALNKVVTLNGPSTV